MCIRDRYSPAPLTDQDKMRIDGALMGRGLHCEFGFEPVNLNTCLLYTSAAEGVTTELITDLNSVNFGDATTNAFPGTLQNLSLIHI